MKTGEHDSGFTIIEVIIFLAITSLMVGVALLSVRGKTAEVQFKDAVVAYDSFLSTIFNQSNTGALRYQNQNCRWDGAAYDTSSPSDGTCIFLGYILEVDYATAPGDNHASELIIHQMYGARLSPAELAACPDIVGPLACANPIVIPEATPERFTIPWSVNMEMVSPWKSSHFGFLRDPSGNQLIIPVSLAADQGSRVSDPVIYQVNGPTGADGGPGDFDSYINEEYSTIFCLYDDTRSAMLIHGNYDIQYSSELFYYPRGNTTCT